MLKNKALKFLRTLRSILHNRLFWIIGSGTLIYILGITTLPYEQLRDFTYYLSAAISLIIVVLYLPSAFDSVRHNRMESADQFLYGLIIIFFSLFVTYSWVGIRRNLHIDWMYESPILTYFIWLTSIGGMLYIIAPGTVKTNIPKRNVRSLIVALALSITITLVFIIQRYTEN